MRALSMAGLMCLVCGTAAAETVPVRAGEHDGFTRIVLQLPAGVTWSLGRGPDGYLLETEGAGITYDLGAAFDYISRQRIAGIRPVPDSPDLAIDLACTCHVVASQTPAGLLVIDVKDGSGKEIPSDSAVPVRPETDLSTFWLDRLPQAGPGEPVATPDATAAEPKADPARMQAAAHMLEWQISRAMGQGLVEPAANTPAVELEPAPVGRADGPDMPAPAELGVGADTVLDHLSPRPAPPGQAATACPEAEDLAIGTWADDRDFGQQLAEANAALVGEFDAPDKEQVLRAARLHLHFGLGAEAAHLLDSFGISRSEDHLVSDLAEILEGTAEPDNRLISLDCDGVLLWRVLGAPAVLNSGNASAVLARFSALPVPLRDQLGPRLIDILLARDDLQGARSIRDAMVRGSIPSPDIPLLDLKIGLANPAAHPDPDALVAQLSGLGDKTPPAVVLAIEAYHRKQLAVPRELTELVQSLAYEFRDGRTGGDLRQALMLALASEGRFTEALAENDALSGSDKAAIPPGFLGALAAKADDGQFLQVIFDRMDQAQSPEHVKDWGAIGTRLVGLGFPREAAGFQRRPAQTEADHLLSARIALAEGRAEAALDALRGLASSEAVELRERIQSNPGSPVLPPDPAVRPPLPDAGPEVPSGLLARTRALLDRTGAERKQLEAMIEGSASP